MCKFKSFVVVREPFDILVAAYDDHSMILDQIAPDGAGHLTEWARCECNPEIDGTLRPWLDESFNCPPWFMARLDEVFARLTAFTADALPLERIRHEAYHEAYLKLDAAQIPIEDRCLKAYNAAWQLPWNAHLTAKTKALTIRDAELQPHIDERVKTCMAAFANYADAICDLALQHNMTYIRTA
jgi:hypothetical protein